jgi:PAS domain S-box-containing protein
MPTQKCFPHTRRQSEAAIKKLCAGLFANASDIIFTCDLAGRFALLNKAGEQTTGYTRDEALRMNLLQVVGPEKRELAEQWLARAAQGETPPCGLDIPCPLLLRYA